MIGKIFGGSLLVTGTTIGAGMLALPILTGPGGFYPSLVLLLICWLATVYSAFLILEVNLWFSSQAHLITMAKETLGRFGAFFTWLVYLLLLYALTAAYIAGGSPLLHQAFAALGWHPPSWLPPTLFIALFGPIIYMGTRSVDLFNRVFMLGLVATYALLLKLITPHVQMDLLRHVNVRYAFFALPVAVTAFGFQMIVPSICIYLNRNLSAMKWVIWLGTGLPFFTYVAWLWATLGVVPLVGSDSLFSASLDGLPATYPLSAILQSEWITRAATLFAFFSVITSFLGASLSLSNFLSDGLQLANKALGKTQNMIYTFAVPLLFVIYFPKGFITALEYAGIFFAILLQILPICMIYKGRYLQKRQATYRVMGGKKMLALFMLYSFFIIFIELLHTYIKH